MNRSRLRALVRKEFTQSMRDYALVALVVYLFLETALCAWALSLDARNLPVVVYDLDRSPASRTLIERLARSESLRLVHTLARDADVADHLDRGLARMVVVIPGDFAHHLSQRRTATVQVVLDGSDSYTATVAMGYASQIVQGYAQEVLAARGGALGGRVMLVPQVRSEARVSYDPALDYTHFNVLVMVAQVVPMLGVLLAAGAIVREKEAGTLEQLMVTPIRPWELIVAKIIPMTLLELGGLVIGVAIAVWGFGAPVRGSLPLFFAVSLLAFLASTGIGVAIAAAARTMQQALLLSFFVLFPLMFLSGTVTPISNMPVALQWLAALSPLRYFAAATVGIFMKGAGLGVLWPQIAALGGLGTLIFSYSLVRLRRGLA